MLIWAITDDRAGNNSQVLGVAEALGLPFIQKKLSYNKFGRISNRIKGASLLGLSKDAKKQIVAPWPDIVLTVASKMEPVALYIKKHNPNVKLIHIQRPRLPIKKFDLVATPEHDFFGKGEMEVPENVILTLGAPNRITAESLAEGRVKWAGKFSYLPKPLIGLLVGGSTNKGEFTGEYARELADAANKIAGEAGASFLVTTSRRTPKIVKQILRDELKNPKYFYDADSADENPYSGLLACADIIIPTGDSISMCSESCSTGKPVYIYSPQSLTPPKYQYFQKKLIASGYAHMLGDKLKTANYAPLCDAKIIAAQIIKKYC